MIPKEDADKILDAVAISPANKTETVDIMDSLGRVLAQDIVSAIHMPPFDKSAMDGYALKADDNSPRFQIIETIAAGMVPTKTIHTGQCAKIMTGAMLPNGAHRVVKVEVTEEQDGYMQLTGDDHNPNICFKGEDIKPGMRLLTKGHMIRPPEVGIIASMGMNKVHVYPKPNVAVVTTGTEIVNPGNPLAEGQIYNSNAFSISAQINQAGANAVFAGIVSDDENDIRNMLADALEKNDMVLISGGVSMGDYDFVPAILNDLGLKLRFDKVAIQPGKPTVFGTYEKKNADTNADVNADTNENYQKETLVFGLPGNPVSTFTIFEIFVRPILARLMGTQYTPMMVKAEMKNTFKRKRAVRTAYLPVKFLSGGLIETLEYHGSAHLAALSSANAFLEIPVGTYEIPAGQVVHVRQI